MDLLFFKKEMSRLANAFREGEASNGRLELIWREVKEFSDDWLKKTVDGFMFNCSRAPLGPEWREQISLEKDRLWNQEKSRFRVEAKEFMSIYTPEELKLKYADIRARIRKDAS